MSVQIIEKSGKPEYAVIPYAEYQALLEMAREDESIPAAVSERLVLGDEHPLKVWREYRGYTQESLGAEAGIGKSYVSQIEAGTKTGAVPRFFVSYQALRREKPRPRRLSPIRASVAGSGTAVAEIMYPVLPP